MNPNAVFVPEMEEVRVSAIVSKRGYINICDQRTKVRLRIVAFDDKRAF